jgi:enterochelin esterase family protein
VGFKALDLFASFGILSAGDPDSEKSTPEFLNDPQINQKVAYLFVGLGTYENAPTNRSVVFHQILPVLSNPEPGRKRAGAAPRRSSRR